MVTDYQIVKDIGAAPRALERQLIVNKSILNDLIEAVKNFQPKFVMTIGRGSSDHACLYGKYLLETQLGLVTASAAPSVVTLYNANLHLEKALVFAVSQSGQSPDICQTLEFARRRGALTVAIVNDTDSSLANIAEFILPLCAEEEKAVAATKTYIASLFVFAYFTALFTENKSLLAGCEKLPSVLKFQLESTNWDKAATAFLKVDRALVIARGYGYGLAMEAALKFKEAALIQAEAFSAAEFLHGPVALAKPGVPFLVFTQNDVSFNGTLEIAEKIKNFGGRLFMTLFEGQDLPTHFKEDHSSTILSLPASVHPILDPIMIAQAFYPLIAHIAIARGFNPDAPEHLRKITETI